MGGGGVSSTGRLKTSQWSVDVCPVHDRGRGSLLGVVRGIGDWGLVLLHAQLAALRTTVGLSVLHRSPHATVAVPGAAVVGRDIGWRVALLLHVWRILRHNGIPEGFERFSPCQTPLLNFAACQLASEGIRREVGGEDLLGGLGQLVFLFRRYLPPQVPLEYGTGHNLSDIFEFFVIIFISCQVQLALVLVQDTCEMFCEREGEEGEGGREGGREEGGRKRGREEGGRMRVQRLRNMVCASLGELASSLWLATG